MIKAYRILTLLFSPIILLLLYWRRSHGKEDAKRMPERLGYASVPRPSGKLVWIHAASVGEANAALPLMEQLLSVSADMSILLTTVTVTSAALMRERLPARAIHQFAPVDTPFAVERFLDYWYPALGIFIDSELWPNLIIEAHEGGTVLAAINARLSAHSFARWQKLPSLIRPLLKCFSVCFAQTSEDAERLLTLGIEHIHGIGNLKYDAPPLPYNEADAAHLKSTIANRPLWLAASTHPGEEEMILRCHQHLKQQFAGLLTIIVPRHAVRGEEITVFIRKQNLSFAQRSKKGAIQASTDIYLADTMGELGLFYRIAPIAFIGGSLVAHGGQNPIEAAQLGAAIIIGPYTGNFSAIISALTDAQGCKHVNSENELLETLALCLASPDTCATLAANASAQIKTQNGIARIITNELRPYLL